MTTALDSVEIKTLRGPIKELKVRKYRILFFIEQGTIYFVSGFIKKTQKIPSKELLKAEAIYNKYIYNIKYNESN